VHSNLSEIGRGTEVRTGAGRGIPGKAVYLGGELGNRLQAPVRGFIVEDAGG
jgi:hypothetical protein